MMTFSLFMATFSTYAVFSRKIYTDLVMIHVLGFAAISAGAFLFTGSINAFITAWFLFMVAGIYWTVCEISQVLDRIKE